jgi:hypothetical protein
MEPEMPFKMPKDTEWKGRGKYKNAKGNTECAYFLQKVTGANLTKQWTPGVPVKGNSHLVETYTAIACFHDGKYGGSDGKKPKDAAIYLTQDAKELLVLDQWNKQDEVKERTLTFGAAKFVDNGDNYCVIKVDGIALNLRLAKGMLTV